MKICIILGTRPEIIKLAPVINECVKKKLNFFVVHTNQHYSTDMDSVFFNDLNLNPPRHNLNIGSGSHGEMTGKMIIEIEKILIQEKPSIVLVQGDTNTVLAGALAASKLGILIGHVEAGLRSYDRKMPEEINRILVDHISDFLFAPTRNAEDNLIKEGISRKKIFNVGNTVVDALFHNLKIAEKESLILRDLGLLGKEYALFTMHRPSNTDSIECMTSIFEALDSTRNSGVEKIIFPAHPRVAQRIKEYKLNIPKNIIQINPIGYLDMLLLIKNADIVITDSGGVQEESCILKVPCVTLRESTERPETLSVGGNILVGCKKAKILNGIGKMSNVDRVWKNPFGDGKSAGRIIGILEKEL